MLSSTKWSVPVKPSSVVVSFSWGSSSRTVSMFFLALSTVSVWVMVWVSEPMTTSRRMSVHSYLDPSRSNASMGSVAGSVLGERS